MNLFDQVSRQLLLFTLTDASFVTDPRVQGALDFLSNCNLLLKSECLSLELSGFAGELEQGLGNIDQILHLTGFVDAALNSQLVVSASLVQDTLDTLNVLAGHVVVGFAEVLEQDGQETTGGDKDKSFFVEDIDFLGNEESGETGAESDETSLGDERVAGKRVNDAGSLLLGVD